MNRVFLGIAGFVAYTPILFAQPLPPQKAVDAMKLPDGFRATLVAGEPDLVQPISMCLDDRGRVWVAEALNYGKWQPTGKDRIVILEKTKDGVRRKVFYEGLNYVTGIEVGFGGVWVMSPPCLYFIPDRNHDDIPDGPPEVLFDGFGYKESRHNLANGFTWGPDGWLYAGHGRTSPSDVGRPGTPAKDRIHVDGGVVRIHPTKLVFENWSDGLTNPWGVDFDDYGACFVPNSVDPHLFHMIQGGHYEPWRGRATSRYAYERLPTIADHLHYPTGKPREMRGESAEVLAMGGGHSHCGTLIYLGDQFPAQYRNTVFLCNIHGRRINNDILTRKGSGYVASHGKDFMLAGDPWFMGVTLRQGPDGSIYVSDWSDTGECHTYKPHTGSGRIFRISYGPPKDEPIDLAKATDEELVKLQLSRSEWHVRHARRLLQERAADPKWNAQPVHQELRAMLESPKSSETQRLRAMWALWAVKAFDSVTLQKLLIDQNEHLRGWAVQLLCESSPSPEAAVDLALVADTDSSPIVRLKLASAMQRLSIAQRRPIAVTLIRREEDAQDANIPLMIWYGVEPMVPEGPEWATWLARSTRIPKIRQFIARRLVDEAIARKKDDFLRHAVEAVVAIDDESRLDLLAGIRDGLRGKKSMPMPDGWSSIRDRLTVSKSAAVRSEAMKLSLIFGDPRVLVELRRMALARDASIPERTAAIESLVEKQPADLAGMLQDLLAEPKLRRVAIRGLASYSDAATPKRVLACYAELTPEEKTDAIATLAGRKEYAAALLDAVADKTVPRSDVSAYVARQLHALGDDAIDRRLRDVWGEVRESSAQKQQQIAKYKAMVSPGFIERGDSAAGRVLFSKMCGQCHTLYGAGAKIGPDLTGSNRNNIEYLLRKIIDPSAEVSKDFRMSIVTTPAGRVITGMIADRTESRITLQTVTERIVLAKEDIETVRESPLSMMPEGQLDTLSREQVRDLFAYLTSKSQAALPITTK